MPGTLVISTLSDGTNSTSATNPIRGSAKAWVKFDGTTAAITTSFNVTSITKNGTGDYTVNFTSSMSSANYCAVVFGGKGGVAFGLGIEATAAPTAAAYRFLTYGSSFTVTDTPNNCVAIFSA